MPADVIAIVVPETGVDGLVLLDDGAVVLLVQAANARASPAHVARKTLTVIAPILLQGHPRVTR